MPSEYRPQPAERPAGDSPSAPERLGPVGTLDRISAVDVLRGVAVLGILVINMDFFAFPLAVNFDPSVAGRFAGVNVLTWQFGYLFFLQKMMAVFSMLFGAGLILMHERAAAAGVRFGAVYYRRILWLLLFGIAHGYLIWYGDILYAYAVCGLLLYPLRRRSARLLIILGLAIVLFGALVKYGAGAQFAMFQQHVESLRTRQASGETLAPSEERLIEQWESMRDNFQPTPEKLVRETEAYRGGYLHALRVRIPQTLMMQTQAFLFMMLWRVLGLMLLGMGLMKAGVFSAARSRRFYYLCMVIGYGIGLPVVYYGSSSLMEHRFDFIYFFQTGSHFNYFGSILVTLGHVGLVMTVYKAGALTWLSDRLAAVGRMALTNYLMHSIIGTTVFYGHGLGLFGRVERFWLLWIAVAIWILQLMVSPLWLRHFRFGPAEWLWRSLTYWKRQPMKAAPAT